MRRTGDTISISGDYQHKAASSPRAAQRFWHYSKKLVIRECLPPRAGDLVMDVGCGSGVISGYLGEFGAEVIGVDGNQEAVAFARATFGSERVKFLQGHVDKHIELGRKVDKIYCLEVIEHLYPEQGGDMLRAFHGLLAEEGKVFLTTPNYRSTWPIIEWILDAGRWVPRLAEEQHVAKYHPASLRALALESGFRVDRLGTMCFVAPWLAPLSWPLAERIARREIGMRWNPGSICFAVLEKEIVST